MEHSSDFRPDKERLLLIPEQMDARLRAIEQATNEQVQAETEECKSAARAAFMAAVYWRGSGD